MNMKLWQACAKLITFILTILTALFLWNCFTLLGHYLLGFVLVVISCLTLNVLLEKVIDRLGDND